MAKWLIGVTDCSKYLNYASWISQSEQIETIKLSERENNWDDVKRCHGILLSGGEDVHPRFYHKPEYLSYCHQDDVNEMRDEFEFRILEYTETNKVPVLGICRGLQVANVFFGGDLIPDIPTWGKFDHGKLKNGKDRYHTVAISPSSWFAETVGVKRGEVNSNHHQSADKIGKGLVVCAVSEEGVCEALERKNTEGAPFLGLVQWHPERMSDQSSPLVVNIKEAFLKAVHKNI